MLKLKETLLIETLPQLKKGISNKRNAKNKQKWGCKLKMYVKNKINACNK